MRLIGTTGVGKTEKQNVPETLLRRLGFDYDVIAYQDIIETQSDKLAKKHTTYGSFLVKLTRRFAYDYAYDETSYNKNKEEILDRLQVLVDSSKDEDIAFVGHSWGCVIFYDFIRERRSRNVKKLITFGNPIPLNKGEDYTDLDSMGVEWINYWEKNDPIAHKMLRLFVSDIEFKNPHWLRGRFFFSHIGYFKSKKMAK